MNHGKDNRIHDQEKVQHWLYVVVVDNIWRVERVDVYQHDPYHGNFIGVLLPGITNHKSGLQTLWNTETGRIPITAFTNRNIEDPKGDSHVKW